MKNKLAANMCESRGVKSHFKKSKNNFRNYSLRNLYVDKVCLSRTITSFAKVLENFNDIFTNFLTRLQSLPTRRNVMALCFQFLLT